MESEVPDADAQEQSQEVTPATTAPTPPATRDDEAPEADALEQAQEVPLDDDDERA